MVVDDPLPFHFIQDGPFLRAAIEVGAVGESRGLVVVEVAPELLVPIVRVMVEVGHGN